MANNNRDYISFLNSLHSASGDNKNAFAEANITSPYFAKTNVSREVGGYIEHILLENDPFLLILTGHAGDGKTSLMIQVLLNWGVIREGSRLESECRFQMPNGKHCTYVKDFSEDNAEKQLEKLTRYVELVRSGEYVFLVANTGPLIASFRDVFSKELQTKLVNAIDKNDAAIADYDAVPVAVLNAATIDNAPFVRPFLAKILDPSLWTPCSECEKAGSCPICSNANLVRKASERVISFLTNHYIWQQEHDRKLTIRQIVAHITYSLTGGRNCDEIEVMATENSARLFLGINLFSNLFFGYRGAKVDSYGSRLKAVEGILREHYDEHRLKADEKLFITGSLNSLLPEVRLMLEQMRPSISEAQYRAVVRRAYLLFDTNPDAAQYRALISNVFSAQFPRFLELRGGETPSLQDKKLVLSALQMLFLGMSGKRDEVKITFMRSSGITQSVQMLLDVIKQRNITLTTEKINEFSSSAKRHRLMLSVNHRRISEITLPMLDYFDELRSGAIATNIDPLLSHGIDSLKAQLMSICVPEDNLLSLAKMSNDDWIEVQAEYDTQRAVWTLQ